MHYGEFASLINALALATGRSDIHLGVHSPLYWPLFLIERTGAKQLANNQVLLLL